MISLEHCPRLYESISVTHIKEEKKIEISGFELRVVLTLKED